MRASEETWVAPALAEDVRGDRRCRQWVPNPAGHAPVGRPRLIQPQLAALSVHVRVA